MLDDDWDIIEFATQLQNLAGGKVKFETIPGRDINGMTDYGESIVQVDPNAVRDSSPDSSVRNPTRQVRREPPRRAARPDIDPSSVTVDVSNDTDLDGLASSRRNVDGGLRPRRGRQQHGQVRARRSCSRRSDSDSPAVR